jgi:hypothetical protein
VAAPRRGRWRCAGVAVCEHAAHLIELSHHRLTLEPAATGGVPGSKHLDGAIQFPDSCAPKGRLRISRTQRGRRAGDCRGRGASAARDGRCAASRARHR